MQILDDFLGVSSPALVRGKNFKSGFEDTGNEKPIHRVMCYLSAAGNSPKEIAEATGFTVERVRFILTQPRSRQLIANILATNFDSDIGNLLKGAAVDAVIELRHLALTAKNESVRRASCTDILDRYEVTKDKEPEVGPKGLLKKIKEAQEQNGKN